MKNTNEEYKTFSEMMNKISDMQVLDREEEVTKTEIWEKVKPFQMFIILFMAFLDFEVFYQVLDRAMIQMAFASKLLSFGFAFALNFIPTFIAKEYHAWNYRLKKHAGAMLIGLVTTFFMMFFAMMWVRLEYSDMFMASTGTGLISSADQAETATHSSMPLMILFSVSPLVTSVICGYMSYKINDPIKPLLRNAKLRRRELITEIHRLEYAKECLERETQSLEELDNGRYAATQEIIRDRCLALRAKALLRLEEYLGNADAVSVVSEDANAAAANSGRKAEPEEKETAIRILPDEVRGA